MFSLPSRLVASMLSWVLSLVSPRLMGRAWLILIRLSSVVVDSRFMVDWLRDGSHVPPVVILPFSRLALILQMSVRLSCMYVMWLATSKGSKSCPLRAGSVSPLLFWESRRSSSIMPGTLANWTSMTCTMRARLGCLWSSIWR